MPIGIKSFLEDFAHVLKDFTDLRKGTKCFVKDFIHVLKNAMDSPKDSVDDPGTRPQSVAS